MHVKYIYVYKKIETYLTHTSTLQKENTDYNVDCHEEPFHGHVVNPRIPNAYNQWIPETIL